VLVQWPSRRYALAMAMTREEADSILAQPGGVTDLHGFVRGYEALLVRWGIPEEEREERVRKLYEEHSGLATLDQGGDAA
jgi:hypothetical protein